VIKYFLILILGLFGASCRQTNTSNRIINDLSNYPDIYSELVDKIKVSDSLSTNGTLINFNELPADIVKIFSKTVIRNRVDYISIDKLACGDISLEIIMKNDHLEYSACPESNFPKPNTYKKSDFIEIWGINENWYLWIDNDPI
jgi:hypothetical protein